MWWREGLCGLVSSHFGFSLLSSCCLLVHVVSISALSIDDRGRYFRGAGGSKLQAGQRARESGAQVRQRKSRRPLALCTTVCVHTAVLLSTYYATPPLRPRSTMWSVCVDLDCLWRSAVCLLFQRLSVYCTRTKSQTRHGPRVPACTVLTALQRVDTVTGVRVAGGEAERRGREVCHVRGLHNVLSLGFEVAL
jgi:hypothetical protein